MPETCHTVVVGSSVRYLAVSARRAGCPVLAVDAYGDSDTRSAAQAFVKAEGAEPQALVEATLAALRPLHGRRPQVVYGSGFEASADALKRLAPHADVIGNRPAVLQVIADPRRWFALLAELEINFPEVRFEAPSEAADWLVKRAGSCGGMAVRALSGDCRALHADEYFQRRVDGPAVSALFAADGMRARVIGFNRLYQKSLPQHPYAHAGGINRSGLVARQQDLIGSYIERLTRSLGLRGINGVDLLLDADRPLLLELNPRPTAHLELYDADLPGGGLGAHMAAVFGQLPERPRQARDCVRGMRVLYANRALRLPNLRWPAWASDRPAAGQRIAAHHPLCTVHAQAASPSAVERLLGQRGRHLAQTLSPDRRHAA